MYNNYITFSGIRRNPTTVIDRSGDFTQFTCVERVQKFFQQSFLAVGGHVSWMFGDNSEKRISPVPDRLFNKSKCDFNRTNSETIKHTDNR